MSDPKPFLVVHADGRSFELNDVDAFVRLYQPQGFAIDPHPPTGYAVPEVPKPKKADKASEKSADAPAEPPRGDGKRD